MKRERRKRLNPTLWRTCRVLTGATRLALLRRLLRKPGQTVSQLAEAERVSMPRASQELRRLQSRGLLTRSCQGASVVYLPTPDPQVPSAAPLLKALRATWAAPHATVEGVAHCAAGLGSGGRAALVRALSRKPRDARELAELLRMGPATLKSNLKRLRDAGWIAREGKQHVLRPPSHPFMAALLKLL